MNGFGSNLIELEAYARQRGEALLAEAEHARLVRQARPPRRPIGDYLALAVGTLVALSSSLRAALHTTGWSDARRAPSSPLRPAH